jgi:cellulose synthase operon protein C
VPALQAKVGVLAGQQNWADAEAVVRKVADMPEHQALAYTLYGGLYYAQQRHEDAIAAYEAAHRLAPTAVEPITGVTMAHLTQQAPEEAARFLEGVIEEYPTHAVAHNLLGETRLRQNQVAEAEQQFRHAIEADDTWAVP